MGRTGRELRALRRLQRDVWGHGYYDAHYNQRVGPRPAPRGARCVGVATIALGAALVVFGVTPMGAYATRPNPLHKITLCHRTGSYSNPYVVITVDVASVKFEGHDGHNGPVFFATIPKHEKWGDIIPPFDFGPSESYPGKNWDSSGMAVFNNQCVMPTPTTMNSSTSTAPSTTTTPTTVSMSSTSAPSSTTSPSTSPTSSTSTPSSTTSSSTSPSSSTSTTAPGTVTTAGHTATTIPAATTTTAAGSVTTLAASTTTTRKTTRTGPLAFTGARTDGLIVIGLSLIGAGIGLTKRRRART